MKANILFVFCLAFTIFLLPGLNAQAAALDSDHDGLSDEAETSLYQTDPGNPDTDSDGFGDSDEIKRGYSPLTKEPLRLAQADTDNDGLSDALEISFGTDLKDADTDKDGFGDGLEIRNGYDPLSSNPDKLAKKIAISLKDQQLEYYLKDVKLGAFAISSGVRNSTPKGEFKVLKKIPKAWSTYGLWMPYWLDITGKGIGIHELPIWPSGKQEGKSHLGTPVSHGCIRLDTAPAKLLYNWADIGTPVVIK